MPALILFVILLSLGSSSVANASEAGYAQAIMDAPVLNSPDFRFIFGGADGSRLLTDRCGQIRAVEYVAPAGTLFRVEGELKSKDTTIYRVTTGEYPCPPAGCFVDGRSVQLSATPLPERIKNLPSREEILTALKTRIGTRYVWGGNVAGGVSKLPRWYPSSGSVDTALWQLAGLDCSGLLYEATYGFTPRNTSQLVSYGSAVKIAGKSAAEIAAAVRPLDLIVWPGHVIIVIDDSRVIESRLVCGRPQEGVRTRRINEALQEVMKNRKGVDHPAKGGKEFSIRRWYGSRVSP